MEFKTRKFFKALREKLTLQWSRELIRRRCSGANPILIPKPRDPTLRIPQENIKMAFGRTAQKYKPKRHFRFCRIKHSTSNEIKKTL